MGGEGDSGDVGGRPSATVHIRSSNGSKFSVQTDLEATVGAFKAVVAGSCDVPVEQQRLIYKGRILKDEQTLASYGVESDHTIHLVRGAAPLTTSAAAATTNPVLGASRTTNSSSEAGLGGSLFPGLGVNGLAGNGASGLFGTGLPGFDQVQQQLTQNPNMMRDIMNMPAMQSLMSNPDLMRTIIMNNPQMREIIDRNPDLAHILNDPAILRQTLEAARNPELMREMMRNTDRAMSNIESSPEGFNMLRRMYETVQEPFLNATTMAGERDAGSNPFAALLGNRGTTRTNDPSANLPATGSESTTGSPAPNANPLPNPWSTNSGDSQLGNTRSTPASGTRATAPGGLGGLGLPDLERMVGSTQDSSLVTEAMQNPALLQMMQNFFSDPQTMNQMLSFNPGTRSILESNTQLREMFQNPEFLRQLTSPETLQELLSFQQSFLSQIGRQQPSQHYSFREQNQAGGGTGIPSSSRLELLMNMFSGFGAGGLGIPNTSNVPPEELYATQLAQLQEMGFFDTQENIRALSATAGNVHAAVERLLGNLGQ
ncbi:ubiquitin domain-containing protein DSK2b-like isoform X1 [Typha angustifolia]|uniref:ubiquitin domain-containing protein DSK2b-like isoform X1 n=1 Tax=Typha angustifolia TaxID=59011 RepID=UPI003C2FFD6A